MATRSTGQTTIQYNAQTERSTGTTYKTIHTRQHMYNTNTRTYMQSWRHDNSRQCTAVPYKKKQRNAQRTAVYWLPRAPPKPVLADLPAPPTAPPKPVPAAPPAPPKPVPVTHPRLPPNPSWWPTPLLVSPKLRHGQPARIKCSQTVDRPGPAVDLPLTHHLLHASAMQTIVPLMTRY